MPRVKFMLASDAGSRDIDCFAFYRENGKPLCSALRHPYCLQAGGGVCSFCLSKAEYARRQEVNSGKK